MYSWRGKPTPKHLIPLALDDNTSFALRFLNLTFYTQTAMEETLELTKIFFIIFMDEFIHKWINVVDRRIKRWKNGYLSGMTSGLTKEWLKGWTFMDQMLGWIFSWKETFNKIILQIYCDSPKPYPKILLKNLNFILKYTHLLTAPYPQKPNFIKTFYKILH